MLYIYIYNFIANCYTERDWNKNTFNTKRHHGDVHSFGINLTLLTRWTLGQHWFSQWLPACRQHAINWTNEHGQWHITGDIFVRSEVTNYWKNFANHMLWIACRFFRDQGVTIHFYIGKTPLIHWVRVPLICVNKSSLVQIMARCLVGAKPLSELMLEYSYFDS